MVYKSLILTFRIPDVISQFYQDLITMTIKYYLSKKDITYISYLGKSGGEKLTKNNNAYKKPPNIDRLGFSLWL